MSSSMSIICGVLMTIFAANAHDMNTGYQPPPPNYGPVYPPQQAHTHAPGPVYPQVTYPPVYPPQGDHTHGPAYPPQGPRPTGGCQTACGVRAGVTTECIPYLNGCFDTCVGKVCGSGEVCANTHMDHSMCAQWGKCPKLPICVKVADLVDCTACTAQGKGCVSQDPIPTFDADTKIVTTNPVCGDTAPPPGPIPTCDSLVCGAGQTCVVTDGVAACSNVLNNARTCASENAIRRNCLAIGVNCVEDTFVTCITDVGCTTNPRCMVPRRIRCPPARGPFFRLCRQTKTCSSNTECLGRFRTQCCPSRCGMVCRSASFLG